MEKKGQKQTELKRNAFSEDISKHDYNDFVCIIQKKLQQLEIERRR